MFYKLWLRKVGTLLLIAGFVLSLFTSSFAQSAAIDVEPSISTDSDTTAVHIFLPLVQNSSVAEVTAADLPIGCNPTIKILAFSGYQWILRGDECSNLPVKHLSNNVTLDANGHLHLKISRDFNGLWSCAELYSLDALGFGQYEWQIYGQLEELDPNVVLRLGSKTANNGSYPIVTEFTHSGVSSSRLGHYSVNQSGAYAGSTFDVPTLARPGLSTHRHTWGTQNIQFQSLVSYTNSEFANWNYALRTPLLNIPQQSMSVRMEFCFFSDQPGFSQSYTDEVVIQQFKYTPMRN